MLIEGATLVRYPDFEILEVLISELLHFGSAAVHRVPNY